VIVTPFVEGVTTGSLDDAELFKLGVLLARVHRSAVLCDVPPSLRVRPSDISWLTRANSDSFARWALRQHALTAGVANEGALRTLTHGDPFRDNVLVTATGALVLIDWEDAALDWPAVDLAQAVLAHCDNRGLDLARVECLLAGYHSDQPVQDISLTETLRMAAYAGLVVAYIRYRRHLAGFATADPYLAMWKLTDSLSHRFL
jgi:Ser/Thr protein kinase RdoA (MazF antagonist)